MVAGSSSRGFKSSLGPIRTFNPKVRGSTPRRPTNRINELAADRDSGSLPLDARGGDRALPGGRAGAARSVGAAQPGAAAGLVEASGRRRQAAAAQRDTLLGAREGPQAEGEGPAQEGEGRAGEASRTRRGSGGDGAHPAASAPHLTGSSAQRAEPGGRGGCGADADGEDAGGEVDVALQRVFSHGFRRLRVRATMPSKCQSSAGLSRLCSRARSVISSPGAITNFRFAMPRTI